jgi:hypothetical protein
MVQRLAAERLSGTKPFQSRAPRNPKKGQSETFLKESHCFIRIKSRRPSHFRPEGRQGSRATVRWPERFARRQEKLLRDSGAAAFPGRETASGKGTSTHI